MEQAMLSQCQTRLVELKATGQLPSPSGVALAIMRLAQNEGATVAEIAQVLESDPAMVGRLLKLANSAWAAVSRPITTVQEATKRLGMRAVRDLALGFSLIGRAGNTVCAAFDYKKFWALSLARAVAAQVLGINQRQIAPDEAFTCGLLSDVGTLALVSVYPGAYAAVLARSQAMVEPINDLEREAFATDHQELTIALLQDWGLPELFGEAVRHQDTPETEDLPQDSAALLMARLLHAAEHLARLCVADDDQRGQLLPELFTRCALLSIDEEDVITLGDRVVAEWQEWGKIFEVATEPIPSLAELAARTPELNPAVIPLGTPAGAWAPGTLTILAVSADPSVVQLLTQNLGAAGYTVLVAGNGQDALGVLLECDAQLILADWDLPKINGPELCQTLRQTKIGRQIHIILLTGPAEEHAGQALAAGADDYLVKPIRPEQLLVRVQAAQRVVHLQQEVIRDKEELSRFAADLAVANRTLQQAAYADPLTGLPNRRHILESLNEEWAAATGNGQPLACMIVDIDHFKDVNDTHGHHVGDLVLREVAGVLRSALRRSDLVGRLGGEEFVIVCPDSDRESAWRCAERLRRSVENKVMHTQGCVCRVTVSVGVSIREEWTRDIEDLLSVADRAVYAAKRAGRNHVHLAERDSTQKISG